MKEMETAHYLESASKYSSVSVSKIVRDRFFCHSLKVYLKAVTVTVNINCNISLLVER